MDYSSLSCLTVCEIIGALPHGTFSHSEQRSRPKLEAAVLSLPSQYRQILSDLAFTKQHCKTSLLENNNPSLYRSMRILTMKEIVDALPPETFTLRERRSRASLEDALLGLSVLQQNTLLDVVVAKKRKRSEVDDESLQGALQKRRKVSTEFPTVVSDECRLSRIAQFIDATGSNAVATSVCTVCAGRFFASELREVSVSHLQEIFLLRPSRTHPAHVLTDGMLLHRSPDALHTTSDGALAGNVCEACTRSLKSNKTPPLSLANGTWIGDIPSELGVLTLLERILVALFFQLLILSNYIRSKKVDGPQTLCKARYEETCQRIA